MKRIGVLVNPLAGIGGPAGMKGSDRPEALARARELGVAFRSAGRTTEVFEKVRAQFDGEVEIFAAPGDMGANELSQAGFQPKVVGSIGPETTAEDTERIARELTAAGVELLVFAGGDGTARNVLHAVGLDTLAFGIPTGVKMHSSVFALHPSAAAQMIVQFLRGRTMGSRQEEVVDLDEEQYVSGRVETTLYGLMRVPAAPGLLQSMKSGRGTSDTEAVGAIGQQVADMIRRDTGACYAVGAGTTTAAVKRMLEGEDAPVTLLGVDVYTGGKCLLRDANALELEALSQTRSMKIVISPIGGQGYLFGRGNQQFAPAVLRKVGREAVTVICSPGKLSALRQKPFLVDTGDEALDAELRGYIRVRVGFDQEVVYKVT
nr:ATP-NAD kinase family protein [uncultured Oscillibacter sp.]